MAWNPAVYNKFKDERFAPFEDLIGLLKIKSGLKVIDLGCGTGELTSRLADNLAGATVLGIDSSKEMLEEAVVFANQQVSFAERSIEQQMALNEKWDLVFSNAAIQWVNDHETLIPKIISIINPGGQLLIQIPAQHHNISNKILHQLAEEEPFKTALSEWQNVSPVLDTGRYAALFFENGCKTMTVYEKVYPHILQDADALYDWTSGTAMIRYLENLPTHLQPSFKNAYRKLLQKKFKGSPVFFPFKRILMAAQF